MRNKNDFQNYNRYTHIFLKEVVNLLALVLDQLLQRVVIHRYGDQILASVGNFLNSDQLVIGELGENAAQRELGGDEETLSRSLEELRESESLTVFGDLRFGDDAVDDAGVSRQGFENVRGASDVSFFAFARQELRVVGGFHGVRREGDCFLVNPVELGGFSFGPQQRGVDVIDGGDQVHPGERRQFA